MKNTLDIKALGLLCVSLFLGASGAGAAQVSSLLNGASPTWNRISDRTGYPDSANNGLPYQVLELKSTSSTVLVATITAPTQFDSFLALYASGGFVPTSPNSNLLAADDDSGTYPHASLSKSGLSANTSYYLVVTSYSNQVGSVYPLYGNYTLNLSGDWRVVTTSLGGTFTSNGAINDTATIAPFSGVTVSDTNGDNVSVAITYPAANGTIAGNGLTGSAGSYTLTAAAPATVTANLQGLVFHPTTNQVAPGSTVVTNFTITPSDGGGSGASDSTSKVTVTSVNDAPVNTVVPAISGTATVGSLLTANSGTWSDVDPGASLTYSYQWYRADDTSGTDAAAISGATATTRTLTSADAHKYLRVTVTANDGQGSSTQTASSLWTAVANSAPLNMVVPAISGTATVGNLLTASSGTWSDVDGDTVTYSYQWYRANDSGGSGEAAISGATSNSYTVTAADAHKYLKVTATANDGHGSSNQTASSSRTAILNTLPALGGTFTTNGIVNDNATILPFSGVTVSDVDGDTVSVAISYPAANGTLTGTGLTGTAGSYNLTATTPATVTSNLQGLIFHPTANQVPPGQTERSNFTLTPSDPFGNGIPDSTSQVTATSINDAPLFTGTPAINGSPVVGQTLSLSNTGTSDADGDTVTLSYQWRANGGDISGATSATYTLTAAELGKSVTCVVTANDGRGLGNSTTSFTTGGVTVQPASPYPPDLIGAYDNGHWYLDTSNNGQWEWGSDFYGYFGSAAMTPVVGDWNGDGHTKIGAYVTGTWYFDLNGNGRWDGEPSDRVITTFGGDPGFIPVTGDWNGDGVTEIGVYDPNTFTWYLDYDGNFQYDPARDITAWFGFAGVIPVVGDWTGNGHDKIGVYSQGQWYLDVNGNFAWDGTPTDSYFPNFGGGAVMLPVAGDWTGSGVDRVGCFYNGVWYLDIDGNGAWNPPSDKYLGPFGNPGMVPLVGKW